MIPSLLGDSVTFDIDRAVHYALLWGLEGLELRAVGGPNDRVPFVNESKIRGRLLEGDLPVVAVHPPTFLGRIDDPAGRLNDLAQFEETLEFCRRLNCPRVVVSSFRLDGSDQGADDANGTHSAIDERTATDEQWKMAAEVLRRAGEQAARAEVMICVLNESGFLAPDGRRLGKLMDEVDSRAVVAAWNPADALRAGEEPAAGLECLGGRVGLVRCRNGVAMGNGWEPRSIDSGEIDWPDQLQRLAEVGFDGPLSLDVEAEPQAKWGLRDATTIIRWIRRL